MHLSLSGLRPRRSHLANQHKFITLDALRGIGALMVAEYHFRGMFKDFYFAHAQVLVDMFFMLSGFVLTLAYQPALDRGLRSTDFFRIRIARLYPLFCLGLITGFIVTVAVPNPHFRVPPGVRFLGLLPSLLMLPAPFHAITTAGRLYPFNYPMWSLFYEDVANIYHALVLRRRSWKFLFAMLAVSGILLVAAVHHYGTISLGAIVHHAPGAFVRAIFSYTFGMLLFRVWKTGKVRWKIPAPLVWATLVLAVSAPQIVIHFTHRLRGEQWLDFPIILLVFPCMLLAGASAAPSPRLARFSAFMGSSSYAFYVLHEPFGALLSYAWPRFRGHDISLDAPWSGFLYLLILLGIAVLVDRYFDLPARNFLRRKLVRT